MATAGKEIPLFVDPDEIAVNQKSMLRFFIPFEAIPPELSPSTIYGAGGEIHQIKQQGASIRLGSLAHKMDVKTLEGKTAPGLEVSIDYKPATKGKLKFYAIIWNDRGWREKTAVSTVNTYNKANLTTPSSSEHKKYPSKDTLMKRSECLEQGGQIKCYGCGSDTAVAWISDPIKKCWEFCCK